MTTIVFDSHSHIKRLISLGMPEPQAEVMVDIVAETSHLGRAELATKQDLKQLKSTTQQDMLLLKQELKGEMHSLELRLDNKLKDMQIRLGSMIVALGGVLIAVKYFG